MKQGSFFMYINQVRIFNIRSLREITWKVSDLQPGWHVIIGDNGSGKSTFLRSIALALVGPMEAIALRQDWDDWLTKKENAGSTQIRFGYHKGIDKFTGSGAPVKNDYLSARLNFFREDGGVKMSKSPTSQINPERHLWGGNSGWFSAAYGSFRRFAGGDKDYERLFYSNPRLAAHLSIFGEDVALTESLRWLQDLQFKRLEKSPEAFVLNKIVEFINQEGFLPHQAQLTGISSKGVEFIDGNGCKLFVEDLSDGYRSILSMTFELIRQLLRVYPHYQVFDSQDSTRIIAPGVVLIDEVDAHLHPTWQRRVGIWFRKHFPNLQFFVTTHSPLVCQAATVGTVWRLPKPGSDQKGGMVTGKNLERLLHGSILDAYSTEMFGQGITRSEESIKMLQDLAELNKKELFDGLNDEEKSAQEKLRSTLLSAAHAL
jgi:energy-coupling factor transporter ATP-binding protein EcfA2